MSDSDKIERAKNQALGKHDDHPGVADHVGEAAGGIGGVAAGAAIGSIAGPIGTVIGGIAGAVGGWWAGRAVAEAATAVTTDDDNYYRKHYDATPIGDRSYDQVRPAYHIGQIAARNPDYRGRSFDDIDADLRRGWAKDHAQRGTPCVRTRARDIVAARPSWAMPARESRTPRMISRIASTAIQHHVRDLTPQIGRSVSSSE